jgi:hypothetical protein
MSWQISVYSLLTGSSKRIEPYKRLAMKTGGQVYFFADKSPSSAESFLNDARKFKGSLYEIKAHSFINSNNLPFLGGPAELRVRLLNGNVFNQDSVKYDVPAGLVYLKSLSGNINWILIIMGVFLVLAGFLAFLYYSIKRDKEKAKKESLKKNSASDQPSGVTDLTSDLNPHEYVQEKKIYDNLYQKNDFFDEEDITVAEFDPAGISVSSSSSAAAPSASSRGLASGKQTSETRSSGKKSDQADKDPADIFADDSPYYHDSFSVENYQNPKRYMQEYAYHVLQLALRQGPKYSDGRLTLYKDGPRKETREYDLFLTNTVIGSGKWSHIRIHDSSVSPVHARIRRVDNRYVIYDLLSKTGVYINGKKLLRPKSLCDGDDLIIGRVRLIFSGFSEL